MNAFLEPDEVERATGYVMPSFQLRFCRANGIRAWLNARGEVVVPHSAIDGTKAENDPAWAPDYTPIRREG